VWDDRLDELVELRREYKDEDNETDKAEVLEALNEIRAELDEEYLKRLTHTYESEVASVEEWESVVNSIPGVRFTPQSNLFKFNVRTRRSFLTMKKSVSKILAVVRTSTRLD